MFNDAPLAGAPRADHERYAKANGLFWLPCPRCGKPYGGHEWRCKDSAYSVQCQRDPADDHGTCCPGSGDDAIVCSKSRHRETQIGGRAVSDEP